MIKKNECSIREMNEGDLEQVLDWRNSDRIRAAMFTDALISMDGHMAWFKKNREEKSNLCLVFEFRGCMSGVVSFSQIDESSKKCNWGFYLGRNGLPGGSGAAMAVLALDYVFDRMGMCKVTGEVLSTNRPSINCHRRLGFIQEGVLPGHIMKNGRYRDVNVFALSGASWCDHRPQLVKSLFENEV